MAGRGFRGALGIAVISLGAILALFIPTAITLLIALHLDDTSDAMIWIGTFGAAILGILPIIAGITVANWNADPRTPLGRRYFMRFVLGVAVAEVAAAAAIVIVTAAGVLPAWVAILAIGCSAVLTGLGIWVGETIRRRSTQDEGPELTSEELSPAGARRTWRRIAIAFAVTLVVGLAGALLIVMLAGASNTVSALAMALGIAFLVAAGVCIGVVRPLIRRVRRLFSGDLVLQKKVVGVVWKGGSAELTADEADVAARYASLLVVFFPFQVAQSVFLFLAIGLQRVTSLASGNESLFVFDVIFLLVLGIATAVTVPLSVARPGPPPTTTA